MRASVLRRKWGRWFHIRPIYLGLLFLHLFLRLLNHLLCQLLNQLLSLFRFLSLPGHCILPCCSAISYGQQVGDQADVAVVPASHLDWVERLPLMYVDTHRVFVHAGIDPNCPLDEQDAEGVVWKIYPDDDDSGHLQRHVVHGHHQHPHGPIFKKNRTNLDTLAWYTGRLAIGVFDDAAPGGPIEVFEVNGEPIEKILSSRRSISSLATKRRADEVKQPRGFTRHF